MEIISSRQNALIKDTIKLRQKRFREERGRFLLEGIRLVEEAVKAGCLEEVFFEEALDSSQRGRQLLEDLEKNSLRCIGVSPEILQALAETESPQGVVGVARQERRSLPDLRIRRGLVLILDGLQDPGNLGTICRTAWAAGVDALFCLPGTVEPYNGKTIRATMGGIFHLPIVTGVDWPTVRKWCKEREFQLVAGDLQATEKYFELTYQENVALCIGSEAQGLLNVERQELDETVIIPLIAPAESLNAAVACGILLYEVIRQRTK